MSAADLAWVGGAGALALAGGGYAWFQHYSEQKHLTTFRDGLDVPSDPMKAESWFIGPEVWIDGEVVNRSAGMPRHPTQSPDGPTFDYLITAELHYMTFRPEPPVGKTHLRVRWRQNMPDGVTISPVTGTPGLPSEFTPGYLQRARDNWTGKDKFKLFRWFASKSTVSPIAPGEFEAVTPLDLDHWTPEDDIYDKHGNLMDATTPEGRAYLQPYFDAALRECQAAGFVWGGGTGLGHGIRPDGPGASFTVLAYVFE